MNKHKIDISSFSLHIIAMISMLLDHMMITVIPFSNSFVSIIGRLAFPIYAFMCVEGYFHTHNFKKYIIRIFIFALISEIPYNLMKSGQFFELYDQNVMWTFLISLLTIHIIENIKQYRYILIPIIIIISILLGTYLCVDYSGMGILMVLIFYIFHDKTLKCFISQFILLFIINVLILGAVSYTITIYNTLVPLQSFALLSLIPIWLYNGKQGYHSKGYQYFNYVFYPLHMFILALITLI